MSTCRWHPSRSWREGEPRRVRREIPQRAHHLVRLRADSDAFVRSAYAYKAAFGRQVVHLHEVAQDEPALQEANGVEAIGELRICADQPG